MRTSILNTATTEQMGYIVFSFFVYTESTNQNFFCGILFLYRICQYRKYQVDMKFGKLPLREEVFMDGRKIFDAINTCDDVFIEKVVLDMENRRKKQEKLRRLFQIVKQQIWVTLRFP